MKKVLGYFLRILSIYFFIVLIVQTFNTIFIKEVENQDPGYKTGYYFGAFFVLVLFFWLTYKLFRYSGKLIAYKKIINEVDDIGKDNI